MQLLHELHMFLIKIISENMKHVVQRQSEHIFSGQKYIIVPTN